MHCLQVENGKLSHWHIDIFIIKYNKKYKQVMQVNHGDVGGELDDAGDDEERAGNLRRDPGAGLPDVIFSDPKTLILVQEIGLHRSGGFYEPSL
jgi:hypothetical protein